MNRDALIAAYTAPAATITTSRISRTVSLRSAAVDNLSASERDILTEAIWWHDVVYDATRSDNEELSAQLAERHVRPDLRPEVARLIRLTKSHQVEPGDRLGAILISIDLSILGAEPARYDAYAAASAGNSRMCRTANIALADPGCSAQFAARAVIYPDAALPRSITVALAKIWHANWPR